MKRRSVTSACPKFSKLLDAVPYFSREVLMVLRVKGVYALHRRQNFLKVARWRGRSGGHGHFNIIDGCPRNGNPRIRVVTELCLKGEGDKPVDNASIYPILISIPSPLIPFHPRSRGFHRHPPVLIKFQSRSHPCESSLRLATRDQV